MSSKDEKTPSEERKPLPKSSFGRPLKATEKGQAYSELKKKAVKSAVDVPVETLKNPTRSRTKSTSTTSSKRKQLEYELAQLKIEARKLELEKELEELVEETSAELEDVDVDVASVRTQQWVRDQEEHSLRPGAEPFHPMKEEHSLRPGAEPFHPMKEEHLLRPGAEPFVPNDIGMAQGQCDGDVFRDERAPGRGGSYGFPNYFPPSHDFPRINSDWIGECRVPSHHIEGPNRDILAATAALLCNDLPQADFKKFDGSPLKWCEWSLAFRARIHENPALSVSKKLSYLQAFLEEGPKAKVFGLLWSPDNYFVALRELQRIYGNPTVIVQAYIESVQKWQMPESPEEICSFSTSVTNLVQIFRSMGFESDLNSYGLLSDITKKLPDHMKKSWGRFIQKHGFPTVEKFERWLSGEEEVIRLGGVLNCHGITCINEERRPKSGNDSRTYNRQKSINTVQSTRKSGPKCQFCSASGHWIDNCEHFLVKTPAERLAWYTSETRCFRCSSAHHTLNGCFSKNQCRVRGCYNRRKHTTCLHEGMMKSRADKGRPDHTPPTDSTPTDSTQNGDTHTEHMTTGGDVYLQILPIRVYSQSGLFVDTFAMLDNGSQSTLISKSLADRLRLKGPTHNLTLRNVARDASTRQSQKISITVCDPNDIHSPAIRIDEAWTYDSLCLPSQIVPRDNGTPIWEHVRGLKLDDVDGSDIEMLIGANCSQAMRHCELRKGAPGTPDAIRTPLGWTLLGGSCESISDVHVNVITTSELDGPLNSIVEQFWSIEQFGCQYNDQESLSIEDRKALEFLESKTVFDGSHYEVPMLWKDSDNPQLPNNHFQALKRYQSLVRKLEKDPLLCKQYTEAVGKYIEKGHALKLSQAEKDEVSEVTHYLVHFAVFHPTKRTCRVVFDAALPYHGTSLNDHLMMGPFLTSTLVGILMRFRQGAVPLSADIEACFHQVKVPSRDKDALRFLWSPTLSQQPDIYRMNVHVFGAKCSPCCATYALRRAALDNTDHFSAFAINKALTSYYMDDFMTSVDSEDQAASLAKEMVDMTGKSGFKLTKWVSTSAKVLEAASSRSGICADIDLNLDSTASSRVLGIRWDVKADQFFFTIKDPSNFSETKRGMLSMSCSLFDPMGFLMPFTIKSRMIVQQLWDIKKLTWDDVNIPGEILDLWREWVRELVEIENFRLNRKLWPGTEKPNHLSMHYFGDASEACYAACAYVRVVFPSGFIHCAIVIARARLAPIGRNRLTLTRLELQAAVLSIRLSLTVTKELEFKPDASYFWSDNMTVIKYLHNDERRFKTFEANRVAEIKAHSTSEQWRHCPGPLNPADDASRGTSLHAVLEEGGRWLHGPQFLWEEESKWPSNSVDTNIDDSDVGLKVSEKLSAQVKLVVESPIFDPTEKSNLLKLTRITAWIMRFIHNSGTKPVVEKLRGPLSAAELICAKQYWLRVAQYEGFLIEIETLQQKKPIPKSSCVYSLSPFMDERGVMRLGGRLNEANIPYACKHQIILPQRHHVTKLLIKDCHERLLHAGREHVLAHLRQTYWIPKLRVAIKSVLNECRPCRREYSKPAVPKMAPLPFGRLSMNEPVWSHTGVDLMGPLAVIERRSRIKVWVVLFCSLSIRAIHLDIVKSIDTDSFIMCLRRFIARRGQVLHLYMDRGTNFVGAEPELREAHARLLTDSRFGDELANKGIEFHFNPPKASHMGGSWERLIRSVKKSLRFVLRDRSVRQDVLYTALCEIESAINSRPLSYVGNEPQYPTPLTPNHFLHHTNTHVIPPDVEKIGDSTCRKKWRMSQWITNQLWKRWQREYLPTIAIPQKWHDEKRALSIDDVVIIVDKQVPRGLWPMGRVVEVYAGRDKRIRSAKLKTKNGFLIRPVSALCVLEEAI